MTSFLKRNFIKVVSKFYDPLVDITIGNQTIKVPLAHQLRRNVVAFPDYNFNLPRIIKYTTSQIKDVRVIDIGANIGDTVAFIKNYTDVPILCIDGEEKYIKILRSNVAQYTNVSICHSLVGNETKESNLRIVSERGTAYVEQGKETIIIRTLEDILEGFPDFKNAKILKVDTDGFDTLILRGCSNYLAKVKPVLFFEFDPYLISKNNDDPFTFIPYLKSCGYGYLIFYMNNGDYLLSCSIDDTDTIDQLIHYFSGRNIAVFTDICAFSSDDKSLFDFCVKEEINHFKKARNY